MRGLGLACAGVALSLAACAAAPDYGNAGTGGAGGAAGAYVPPALSVAHSNPIISRHAVTFASNGNGAPVVDGQYHNGGWNAGPLPAWVAIKLTTASSKVLVSWDDGGTYNYEDPATSTVYGFPAEYHFEVSADSTKGTDGTWTPAGKTVSGNQVRTRAQSFDFTGMSWIKMVITAAPANENSNGVQIGEIDVHDISATGAAEDSWFFMGDSITAFAYDRAGPHQPSFAAAINTASPPYFPAMINGGIGGELSAGGLARLDEVLGLNPDYHFICLTYGTNDEWGNHTDASGFRTNLQMMIDKIKAAGAAPILTHVPFSDDGNHDTLPVFNAVIDDLTRTNQLQVGPDFYAYFMAHPDQLQDSDHVHPTDAGRLAMNQQWADAARRFYP
jgi:lysophospholipase L1-like esterase